MLFWENDFCHVGNSLHGECVDRSDIKSGGMFVDTEKLECSIELENKNICVFMSPNVDIFIDIQNLPVGSEIIDSSYSISGLQCRPGKTECPMSCVPSAPALSPLSST